MAKTKESGVYLRLNSLKNSPRRRTVHPPGRYFQQSELPKLLFYATPGAILSEPVVEWCEKHLKNLKTVAIGTGIHLLQEDNPHLIGQELANWYRSIE